MYRHLTISIEQTENLHKNGMLKDTKLPGTPTILVTQEAEIRRITVQSQPEQIVCETLS
jgi:hypothetical protein